MRRGQENQIATLCLEHAVLNWTWSAKSHTGPRHVERCIRIRIHVSTRLRRLIISKRFFLHPKGRPYMSQSFDLDAIQLISGHSYPASTTNCSYGDLMSVPNWPLRIIWAVSIPSRVADADAKDLTLASGRWFFYKPVILFKYLTCKISIKW